MTRAEWVAGQHARADDSVAVAPPPSPVRVRDVHSWSARLGDETFLNDNVSYMASEKRHEFAAELRTAVIETASALLTFVRLSSFQSPELLSVRQAWSDMATARRAVEERRDQPRPWSPPSVGLMMRRRPPCCGQPRRRPWKSFAALKSGAATAVMSGVTAIWGWRLRGWRRPWWWPW